MDIFSGVNQNTCCFVIGSIKGFLMRKIFQKVRLASLHHHQQQQQQKQQHQQHRDINFRCHESMSRFIYFSPDQN